MVEQATVYVSGEMVRLAGTYEVVGAEPRFSSNNTAQNQNQANTLKTSARQHLSVGELFPNHDGRSVSWRLTNGP